MPVAALAIGGIGSIIGGITSSHAASSAANAQVQAANNAANLQHQDAQEALNFSKQQYSDTQRNIAPWLQTGTGALGNLAYLMGIRPQSTQAVAPTGTQSTSTNPGSFPRFNVGGLMGGGNPLANDPNLGTLPPSARGGGRFQPFQDGTAGGGFSANSGFVPRTGMGFDGDGLINGGIHPGSPGDGTSGGLMTGNGAVQASTGGAVNADGSPGMVPRTDIAGTAPAGFNPGDFGSLMKSYGENFSAPTDVTEQNDPGYKFRLQQGQDAIERSAAARGGLVTGGTARALSDYNQNSASNEYSNVYNRALGEYQQRYNIFQQDQANKFNRLAALSGTGQTAAGQLSSSGTNTASNISSILLNSGQQIGNDYLAAGNARGSGYINQANAITGSLNGLTGLASLYALMQKNGSSGGNGV